MRLNPQSGAVAGVVFLAASAAMTGGGVRVPVPIPAITGQVVPASITTPPTTAMCQSLLHVACYQPAQIRAAYDLDPLLRHGLTGRGRTIAIVDALGAPDLGIDLRHFDAAFDLPDPPSLRIIEPEGPPPAFSLKSPEALMWAFETTLDAEWAHVMAPGARILVVVSPSAETEGLAGFPQLVAAEDYVVDHHLADVISQSFGTAEESFPSTQVLEGLRSAFKAADDHDVTVLAATGDTGTTAPLLSAGCCYPVPVVSWPASDPLVTAVGATHLDLDVDGTRLGPDTVWNDGGGASGGGLSAVFDRPGYQDHVRDVVGDQRGTPDVSLSGALSGAVDEWITVPTPKGLMGGWQLAGGTSEATPLFAGIVAIADQAAGHRLGLLNDDLYEIARHHEHGIVPVSGGTNAVTLCISACTTKAPVLLPIPGYTAVEGYNLASGLGTVDAARLVGELRDLDG